MIINPDKLWATILHTKKYSLTNIPMTMENQAIKTVSLIEHLGIQLDEMLNFNLYISNICR